MWNHERLRFTFIVLNFITFLTHGFVIEKRFADKERYSNLHPLPNYDEYDEALVNYYNENTADGHNYKKRDFSPDKLRQQVRERMESIVLGGDNFLDNEMDREDNMLNSVLRKMMKDKQEAMKGAGNLKMSGRYMEEKSTQTKIESDGDKGVAIVTGQTMESSSSGNGSSPVMKVAKVVAVATKDGKENGEWKMKPLQEEVQVMTPSPENAKEKDGDKEVERLKSLFQQRRGFNGRDNLAKLFERGDDNDYYDNDVGHDNDRRNRRRKRSISYEELEDLKNNLESPRDGKSVNDVDLLKNYIALQDAENRHLMQALDLASEIELSNEGDADDDPKTIDEQMYHMRKALEDERALSALRKQIQLSIKNSATKRSSYIPDRSLYDEKNAGFRDDKDYDDDIDYGDLFLERYVRRNEEEEEEEDDDGGGRYDGVQEDDANLMEDWADDITLDRHKLRNEEIIDRLRDMMSQSDEGWQGESRAKKLHPPEPKSDELLDEESLRNLLRAYRKHYKPLEDDMDYPLIFPNGEDDYDVGGDDNDIDPDMGRKILENLARKSFSEYQLNPFFRNITKMGSSEKRFFEENRPMVSSDDDVENTEPWCPKAAKLVDNCLYARLNGLLPDSEAVDLCNAHQLCYKCGSSNGVTSDECDRAFMERSKELCLNEMACKKQAASLYVTMMADRKFYSEMEAPDICTDPCVTSILYTDRSD